MKVVVYLRADDERFLRERGLDPAVWAREQVQLAMKITRSLGKESK